ncbi:uncharacterized protein STAUR_1755 [Stigmatella aurantiaca DW4/3-1]|uniref:Uncharacterized protein n=2 Tax=Stigmatella aurantiaca TaxID=41 RepID=Q09CA9_STIAD|nr:uncharacterized protein STAUR_1755 [Stigmatella aurantiaca DW4/3-1]EAU69380.1 hypothetical protein STIAU_3729 [Stigmatella aurantiaca DW4/3-1]
MDAFYVLRPTQALLAWLKARALPGGMNLERPHLWSQLEAPRDHDYEGQGEDAETFLKLAVLASFLDRLERASQAPTVENDAVTRRVLTELLGPPPLTVATFDRWWHLEPAAGMSSVESTLAHTPVRTLRKVRGPEVLSPLVQSHRSSSKVTALEGGPRPVGERWVAALREREEDAPRLQCAVAWVLERLVEKTPHRLCALWTQPFSLDAPVEEVLRVPGWTLRSGIHDLREGIKLTLEDFTWGDETWTFRYKIYSGERRAASSGTVHLLLEKTPNGWEVPSGSWKP